MSSCMCRAICSRIAGSPLVKVKQISQSRASQHFQGVALLGPHPISKITHLRLKGISQPLEMFHFCSKNGCDGEEKNQMVYNKYPK